jgi:hypothetical protein
MSNVLRGLGLVESVWLPLSYVQARLCPYREEKNLEQWMCNRFGTCLSVPFSSSIPKSGRR